MSTKDIYTDMRKELLARIMEHIRDTSYNCKDYTYEYACLATEMLELCSIPQLWRVLTLILRNDAFTILGCVPSDHLVISIPGTNYVGIEPDGYMHS